MPSSPPGPSRSSDQAGGTSGASVAAALSDPELHRALAALIRRKIAAPDAEDVLQATLADALAAAHVPDDATELRRWVFGVARNKIADYYRAGRREIPHEPPDLEATADGLPDSPEPHSARDLLRWAKGSLPETDGAQQTFDWMLREGQGEKLETIAAEEKLPAPQVRKRVSRLRQHLKRKWVLELAAVAALGLAALVAHRMLRRTPAGLELGPDRTAQTPESDRTNDLRRAAELRRNGLDACAARDYRRCLEQLDQAATLDALGDATDDIRRARESAHESNQPESLPAGEVPNAAPTTAPSPAKGSPSEGSLQSLDRAQQLGRNGAPGLTKQRPPQAPQSTPKTSAKPPAANDSIPSRKAASPPDGPSQAPSSSLDVTQAAPSAGKLEKIETIETPRTTTKPAGLVPKK